MGGMVGRWYMYTYDWFTLLFSRNEHNIVRQLYSNKKKILIGQAKEVKRGSFSLHFWFFNVFINDGSATRKDDKVYKIATVGVLSLKKHLVT